MLLRFPHTRRQSEGFSASRILKFLTVIGAQVTIRDVAYDQNLYQAVLKTRSTMRTDGLAMTGKTSAPASTTYSKVQGDARHHPLIVALKTTYLSGKLNLH